MSKTAIQLMPHQLEAIDWLHAHDGVGLIHGDPGVGKTFLTVEFLLQRRCRRVLILCPASIKYQWQEEILKYVDTHVATVDGSSEAREVLWKSDAPFTIANYELLLTDWKAYEDIRWDAVVADESHYVNSPVAKRTKYFKTLASGVPIRIALSGDPFPNGELHEAFSVIDWFSPGILGKNWRHFKNRFCRMHPQFNKVIGYRDRQTLEKIVGRFVHRIRKEEALMDLKPKVEEEVWVELSKDERKRYQQIEQELRLIVDGKERLTVPNLLAMLMRLRQVIDDPSLFGITEISAKEMALDDLLAASKEKTIVFTEFKSLAHRLRKKYGAELIAGDLNVQVRRRAVKRFMEDPDCNVLVSTAAGGYGLNLARATRVVHLGVPWNHARVNQRVGRAWRKGQEGTVKEVFVLAKNTVDEKMKRLVDRKKENADRISGDVRKELVGLIKE